MNDEQPLSRRDAREAPDAAGFPAAADTPADTTGAVPAPSTGMPETPQTSTDAPLGEPPSWEQPTVLSPTVAWPAGMAVTRPASTPPAAEPTVVLPADGVATQLLGAEAAATGAADTADPAEKAPAEKGGIGALLRKHPTAWIVTASVAAFALLGTGAVFAGVAVASADSGPAAAPTPTVTEEPARAVSELPATASRLRTCSIAGPASDGRLATLYGSIMRADTGEVLFDRNAATAAPPASVLKLFTAAAAIGALGPDFRIRTSVVDGSSPGAIVLVGRGDATLSALPVGQESAYQGAPKLQTLAEQTIASYASRFGEDDEIVPISNVVLDASYWNPGDAWEPSWREDQRTRGYQSAATALQVDGDRADPRRDVSPRGYDPIATAGEKFIQALRAADPTGDFVADQVTTSTGSAVSQNELAFVESQPVRTLVAQMLLPSDNTLGEMLARIVSREAGQGGSAASLQSAIVGQLGRWGVPQAGIVIKDGSGLSPQNAVPASAVSTLLRAVHSGADGLDAVRDGLSIAGQSGTLRERFTGDDAVGRGNVAAKSGMIRGSYTLAGQLTADDGTPLVFTFYATGEGVGDDARKAIDTLTTAALRCGDNLSNY